MWDVIVAGAGPAGSVAATILARAGARVLLLDRARFPRHKLCGDSLNPGTLTRLRRLGLSSWIDAHGLPIDGMLVTGPHGSAVEARYPDGLRGMTVARRDLDWSLLCEAVRAGATFEEGATARSAIIDAGQPGGAARVVGLMADVRGRSMQIPTRVTIAADGRRSRLAGSLGLVGPVARPQRWAVGAYFDGVAGSSSLGEMHLCAREYLGVAPLPDGLTNACLVSTRGAIAHAGGPDRALRRAIDRDPVLRERFIGARMIARPSVLGPLAARVRAAGCPGLLLAGDAAGFIDPMTGDGLDFTVHGAELAAGVALSRLTSGLPDEHLELARLRRAAFAWKQQFDRALTRLIDWPTGLAAAARGAAAAPSIVRALVCIAGDCGSAA